jgi:uncharacterized protein YktA (UPF0223 family)
LNSIKKILLTLSLLTLTYSANSQTYGNEWINYNQDYYDFKIVQDGIYQLDYSTLVNAGIPVNSFQSENIQIFGREKEKGKCQRHERENTYLKYHSIKKVKHNRATKCYKTGSFV